MPPMLLTAIVVISALIAATITFYNVGQAVEWLIGLVARVRARLGDKPTELGFFDHGKRIAAPGR
jgi:hypothetical protein